jgi:hypothetical protein
VLPELPAMGKGRGVLTSKRIWIGWVRGSKADSWRAVVTGATAAEAEALLADIPPAGRLEEGQVLPAGTQPMGRVAPQGEPCGRTT